MPQHKPRKQSKRDLNIVLSPDSTVPRLEGPPLPPQRLPSSLASGPPLPSSSRLLFVEVRGPRGNRRHALQYDRSARELKSHVMLVANEGKRRQQASKSGSGSNSSAVEDDDWVRSVKRESSLAVDLFAATAATRLSPELSLQHVDPFNMLPVEGSPEMHAAIRYYFEHYPGPTPLTDDALVCHKNAYEREKMQWSRVQFSFCQSDRISYHIMLFIWQVMQNLSKDMNFEARKYWARVLQMVREDMPVGKIGTDIPESYVAIIGGLAVAETWLGEFSNSKQHRAAMLKLVAARGGFETFSRMAQRALKWCEYYACAALTLRPALPCQPVQPLPPDLAEMAEAAHRRTMALLPPNLARSELDAILFRLHAVILGLGLANSPEQLSPVASVLDELEHRLLDETAAWKERVAAAPALLVGNPKDVVYCTLLQAAHICIFRTMTFTRKEMPLYALFVATLRFTLSMAAAPRLAEAWAAAASKESLLWVLFVGWAAASQLRGDAEGAIEDAMWFARQCFRVLEALGLRGDGPGEEDLREVLRQFPWSAESFDEPCKALWNMFTYRDELNIT